MPGQKILTSLFVLLEAVNWRGPVPEEVFYFDILGFHKHAHAANSTSVPFAILDSWDPLDAVNLHNHRI